MTIVRAGVVPRDPRSQDRHRAGSYLLARASAAPELLGTVPVMSDDARSAEQRLRQFHRDAERHVTTALSVVSAAHSVAELLDPSVAVSFEYREAVRSLRAALTAIRSAEMDWDERSGAASG